MVSLCEQLAKLGVWTRLHYVYPYPHVDDVIPLMAEGKILPYLDIPLQHASFFGFTREADDKGRTQGQIRADFTPLLDALQLAIRRARTLHQLQNARAGVLQRDRLPG